MFYFVWAGAETASHMMFDITRTLISSVYQACHIALPKFARTLSDAINFKTAEALGITSPEGIPR